MNLFLFAAGLGTRLRPLTDQMAKPAVPLLNVPLMHWCASFIEASLGNEFSQTIEQIIVNTHHKPESLHPVAQDLPLVFPSSKNALHFSHESPEPLGAGGALMHARGHLDRAHSDLVLVANADEFLMDGAETHSESLRALVNRHTQSKAIATLLVMEHPEAGRSMGAAWVEPSATNAYRILGFGRESAKWPPHAQPKHYVGMALVNWSEIQKYLPSKGASCLLYDGLTSAIADGARVEAFSAELVWTETGSVNHLLEATDRALDALSPLSMATQQFKFVSSVLSKRHPGDYRHWQFGQSARALIACSGSSPESRNELFSLMKSIASRRLRESVDGRDRGREHEMQPLTVVVGQGIERALTWLRAVDRSEPQVQSQASSAAVAPDASSESTHLFF